MSTRNRERARKWREELALILDTTVDLPAWKPGCVGYDRETLLMRAESLALAMNDAVESEAWESAKRAARHEAATIRVALSADQMAERRELLERISALSPPREGEPE